MDYLQSLQTLQSYLNNALMGPVNYVKDKLSLKTEALPTILRAPLNFALFFSSLFYFVVANADAFICNMLGITYPIMYCLHTLNALPLSTDKIITNNKYWIIFGSLTILDPILGYVPLYYYVKVIFIYFMVKNDFLLTTYAFEILETQYVRLDEVLKNYDEALWQKLFFADTSKTDISDLDNKKIN